MYVDYSKYTITLNENNTDNTKYIIHQGKAGNDYVEILDKTSTSHQSFISLSIFRTYMGKI